MRRILRKLAIVLVGMMVVFMLGACSGSVASSSGASASGSVAVSQESAGSAGADSSSGGAASSVVAPSTCGKLHVEGTQLVDERGAAVQLRGVSTHGLAWFPSYVNNEFFGELRNEWGANVVRLAMYTAESGGYCTDGDKAQLRKLVDDGVRYATDNDLYVIVDWHILSDNDPNMHADQAEAFFADVSAAYASQNNVIYEICNEPNGGTSWADVKAYAERIIPVIRANDSDALVIVGTPTWSQDVDKAAADPLAFDNVMYALHFYAATHKDDLRAKASSALDAGLPIFVTEFGICDASGNGAIDEDQANEWIAFLDQRGVSYVMWNLSNKAESSAMFKATCDKASGFQDADLSQSGAWLKQLLASSGADANSIVPASSSTSSAGSSSVASSASADPNAVLTATITNGDIEYRAALRTSWVTNGETFYLFDLTLVNNGDAKSSWEIDVPFSAPVKLSDSWNGTFSLDESAGNATVHIANADYNGTIPHGGSVSDVGFIVIGPADLQLAR